MPSAGAHTHAIRRDNSAPPGYLPTGAPPGSVISNSGAPASTNGAFSDRAGTDYTNGSGIISSAGAHTHAIAEGTAVPAPAGSVPSIDNQPAYIDAAFWKRTA